MGSSRRRGSSDSTSSRRSKRQRSYDRYRANSSSSTRRDSHRQRTDDALLEQAISEEPPSYDLSQERDAKQETTSREEPQVVAKPMSKEARVAWAVALSVPLLTSVLLLFLITCSSSDLRSDFSVVKIEISKSTFDALSRVASDKSGSEDSSILADAASLGGTIRKRAADAYLTLGVWGWCTKTASSDKIVCSPPTAWYNMEDSLGATNVGEISGADFSTFLVHTLLLHGLALLGAMLALVPVGLYCYRRYYHNDPQAEGGWFKHGTILAAWLLSFLAWVFDKFLLRSLRKNIPPESVHAGPAVTLVGVATLLLIVSFMTSGIPIFGRFARWKFSFASRWETLEDASAITFEPKADEQARRSKKKKGRSGRRRRLHNRMTKMFW